MKRLERGFSLIELLIVVAIILIIAAIAIPNLLRARMQANEASAVSSIHAINTAEISYSTLFPTVGFAPSLVSLGDGGSAPCPGTRSSQAAGATTASSCRDRPSRHRPLSARSSQ